MLAKYYPAGAREFPLDLMSSRFAAAAATNQVEAARVHYLSSAPALSHAVSCIPSRRMYP